jgi:hypothetical protein
MFTPPAFAKWALLQNISATKDACKHREMKIHETHLTKGQPPLPPLCKEASKICVTDVVSVAQIDAFAKSVIYHLQKR